MDRLPVICLHDFVPGTVQKIAFDQFKNNKLALVYRVLKDQGYIYRVRIYDLLALKCGSPQQGNGQGDNGEEGITSHDDIDDLFDEVKSQENRFINATQDSDYEVVANEAFEDFLLPTNSRITALNYLTKESGDVLTYS